MESFLRWHTINTMTAHIYIIKDGANTKIGISTNLARRLPAYKTHNPNHEVYKTYPCSHDEAKRIELFIKQAFKEKLIGQGKEWFSVPAEDIDKYVFQLLAASSPISDALPSLHGVSMTEEASSLLEKILEAVQKGSVNILPLKEQFAELFAKSFKLGIPKHKLPDDLLAREYLFVDLNYCDKNSHLVHKAVTSAPSLPHSDHCWYFFHLLKLSSGASIAVCTAEVSMPYMAALGSGEEKEIYNHAKDLGLYATFHHDWSWWYPTETALILYQPKTPISLKLRQWEKSFRKWVIERRLILKHEDHEDALALENTIEDIADDKHFPLIFENYDDLQEIYLGKYWNFLSDEQIQDFEYDGDRERSMRFLVKKWKESNI